MILTFLQLMLLFQKVENLLVEIPGIVTTHSPGNIFQGYVNFCQGIIVLEG